MSAIHATAVVAPAARLGEGVRIGPYCIVGENAALEDGVELVSHVVVDGHTRIGARTRVYPFASLGQGPQHLKYAGEPTRLEIGADNVIREHVTMNTGTVPGGGVTRVGDRNFFMVNSHVAHDCIVGSQVVMANNAVLGGHVTVGDYAVFGGNCAVHQFVRIGRYTMISGACGVAEDVIPYGYALALYNSRASLAGLNLVGLKRRGFSREQIHTLRTAYRLLFAEEGTLKERLEDAAAMYRDNEAVMDIVNFIRADANRSICLPTTGRQAPV
jgi:UDP-N-acetylglucosamine acyltransferase